MPSPLKSPTATPSGEPSVANGGTAVKPFHVLAIAIGANQHHHKQKTNRESASLSPSNSFPQIVAARLAASLSGHEYDRFTSAVKHLLPAKT